MLREEKLRLLLLGDKEDSSSDDLITALIEIAEARFLLLAHRICRRLGIKRLEKPPDDLQWIINEVVIRRFNRIGSEGLLSHAVEGESLTFSADDFLDFEDDILAYFEDETTKDNRAGRVVIY